MSAPLYNRYRRYADREAKRYTKRSTTRAIIPTWKRPDTRVYSMSDRASYEAGAWSTSSPGEIMRAMDLHYLPLPQVWIEIDFASYQQGCNGITFGSDEKGAVWTEKGVRAFDAAGSPVRMGFLLYHPGRLTPALRDSPDRDYLIGGYTFYLYPEGTCMIGPAVYGWLTTEPDANRPYLAPSVPEEGEPERALSPFYMARYEEKNPRLLKKLQDRVYLGSNLSHGPISDEVNGTTRMAIAALTAALSARAPKYEAQPPSEDVRVSKGTPERDRTIEVDLFLRERPRTPGKSIRASVGHLEGVKKGLHTVGSHYAYRAREDGGDPTRCTKSLTETHDWEKIEDTKSEVCILCGQKRWFKKQHKRGDEQYGIIPAKTYNIRAGQLPAPEAQIQNQSEKEPTDG